MTDKRALIIDISEHNSTFNPDVAHKAGVDGIIIRLGYGVYPDKQLLAYADSLRNDERFVVGCYHYLTTAATWQDQVDFALKQISKANMKFDFIAADFEEMYNRMSINFGWRSGQWIKKVGEQTNIQMMDYANRFHYRDFQRVGVGGWLDSVPLWIAHYPYVNWAKWMQSRWISSKGKPTIPKTRNGDWSIWQFTSRAPGADYGTGEEYVDLNVYNGTEDEFRKQFGAADKNTGTTDDLQVTIPISDDHPSTSSASTGNVVFSNVQSVHLTEAKSALGEAKQALDKLGKALEDL